MNRLARSLLFLLAVAALAAACTGQGAAPSGVATLGSPSPAPAGSSEPAPSLDPEDAILAFAECMRDHGVDMPDPQVGPNGEVSIGIAGGVGGPDRAEMQAAHEACQGLMEGALGEPQELTPEQKDAMLAFAQCMRDNGVDMPDPQFQSGGAVMIGPGPDGGSGPKLDPESPVFQAAEDACRDLMGEFGRGGAGPGFSTQQGVPADDVEVKP
jgi:hypothetical protein